MFSFFRKPKKKPEVVESEQDTATDINIQETLRRNREALEDREQCSLTRQSTVAGISQIVGDEKQRSMASLSEEELAEWESIKDGLATS